MSIKVNDNTLLSLNEEYHIPEKYYKKIHDYYIDNEFDKFRKENFVKYKDKFDLSHITDGVIRAIVNNDYHFDKNGLVEMFVHDQSIHDDDITKTQIENIIEEKITKCGYDDENLKLLDYKFSVHNDGYEGDVRFSIYATLIPQDDSLLKYKQFISKTYYKYCEKMNKIRVLYNKAHSLELEINRDIKYIEDCKKEGEK